MITYDHVTKQFPDGTIGVDDLSLHVDEGSFTVFVGPSGCGKTTSMRMVNRMIDPTSGVLTVGGRDVTTVPPVELRLGIGYVIQDAGLLPHRTVVDNVATVPLLRGVRRRQARIDALEAMERVGLDLALATRYPAQLSGGQRQRVGVARALAADPPILLMDEPFSAVDPVVRADLQREVRRLQADLRKTIVFVTHDIDEATILGDRIAVFGTGGVLHQYADPPTILNAPATGFVMSLVGRDRGYRSLSFDTATDLSLETIPDTIAAGEVEAASIEPGSWRLVLDDDQPIGWLDAAGLAELRGGASLRSAVRVGSLAPVDGSLRQLLDAALSSPSGIGLVVDEGGAVLGGVRAAQVLEQLEQLRLQEEWRRSKELG